MQGLGSAYRLRARAPYVLVLYGRGVSLVGLPRDPFCNTLMLWPRLMEGGVQGWMTCQGFLPLVISAILRHWWCCCCWSFASLNLSLPPWCPVAIGISWNGLGASSTALLQKVGSSWNMAIHLHRWEQTNHLFWTLKCKRCKRKLLAIWIWGQKPISNSQHQNSDFRLSKLWILEDLYQHAGRDVCDFHCQSSVLAATKQDGGSGWLSNPKGKPALIYLTILICLLFLTNLRNNWNNYECG